jgi:imidazoleglycerol phosphate synthase cyclase subunit
MLTSRIIPCLDVSDNRVVKGVKFAGLRDAGDPAQLAAAYEAQGADEIVVLDVSATDRCEQTQLQTVREVRAALSIPLTVGGGVRALDDVQRLTDAGAERVSVNTAAVNRPILIRQMADRFGTQCTVVAIDARRVGGAWHVMTHAGKTDTGLDAVSWAATAQAEGAGEILLTSFDRDGTGDGYDCELLESVTSAISIPVIASGGANTALHMHEGLRAGASAVLAASILHDGLTTVARLKQELRELGEVVRL